LNEAPRVLLAEDDRILRKAGETSLTRKGYCVIPAVDGEDALEKAFAHRPDLILLDVMMPKMDGFDVLARLKSDAATRDIPVIMLSNLEQRGRHQAIARRRRAQLSGEIECPARRARRAGRGSPQRERPPVRSNRPIGIDAARHTTPDKKPEQIRVLVVEDDGAARVGLQQLIRGWGFDVETAADGDEALRSRRRSGPSSS
jgi:CheY-like chemotaxis protein